MNKVVIGLGSNISPETNIPKARDQLAQKFPILAESRWRQTKPVGYPNQADFINSAILIETPLEHDELKAQLKGLEADLGRAPSSFRFGPRSIDLDILVWNDKIVDPDFYSLDFVKESILELLPEIKY